MQTASDRPAPQDPSELAFALEHLEECLAILDKLPSRLVALAAQHTQLALTMLEQLQASVAPPNPEP